MDDLTPEQLAAMPYEEAVAAVMERDGVSRFFAEQIVSTTLAGGDQVEV